jgi:hypothetical protein
MKTSVFPRMVALLLLGTVTPLLAQRSVSIPRPSDNSNRSDDLSRSAGAGLGPAFEPTGRFEVPATPKAQGFLLDSPPVYAMQDARTLEPRVAAPRNLDAVVDLGVLRNPSHYRRIVASGKAPKPYEIVENSLQKVLERISAVYREAAKPEQSTRCSTVALSVGQRIQLDPSDALGIVQSEVSANPACACEIVKTSIAATDADVPMVVSIVQTAINAAPEHMRIISQCAIAAMPESISQIQALLAGIDPNSGDAGVHSSKSAKSAKAPANFVAAIADPLDRINMPVMAPIIKTRPVTDVDPSTGYDY